MKILTIPVGSLQTNCYLVIDEISGKGFVADPGDNAEKILDAVARENVDVEYVILTHAHFDHILAAREVVEKCSAKLVVCDNEVPALSDPELACYRAFGLPEFNPLIHDIAVSDGDELYVGELKLEFLNTPGHTKGSMCIIAENAIFSGDTLFADSCGRCDFPGGDWREMLLSLKRLAELDDDYEVYSGHGESTTLEVERKFNPYVREAMRQ